MAVPAPEDSPTARATRSRSVASHSAGAAAAAARTQDLGRSPPPPLNLQPGLTNPQSSLTNSTAAAAPAAAASTPPTGDPTVLVEKNQHLVASLLQQGPRFSDQQVRENYMEREEYILGGGAGKRLDSFKWTVDTRRADFVLVEMDGDDISPAIFCATGRLIYPNMVENMTYGTLIDDVIEEEIKVKKDIVKVKLDRGQITLTYTDEFGDSRSWMGFDDGHNRGWPGARWNLRLQAADSDSNDYIKFREKAASKMAKDTMVPCNPPGFYNPIMTSRNVYLDQTLPQDNGVYRTNRRDYRDYDARAETEGFQVNTEPKVVYLDRRNHRQVEIPFAVLHKLVNKDDPLQVAVYFSIRARGSSRVNPKKAYLRYEVETIVLLGHCPAPAAIDSGVTISPTKSKKVKLW